MARVSKRASAALHMEAKTPQIHYKAGIYARLSSDQDMKKNESVEMQVMIAEKHIEELNKKGAGQIEVIDRYVDLGKTGSNFNRDGFRRLMQDVRLGVINLVVVKDLSRFGRNYLEAGNYIENVFPFLGVRFIAVADGFDTGDKGNCTKEMAAEIKNLVNDMYAKDFSVKAKQHLKQKREAGSYVGGPPPYGYVSGWDGKKRKLMPDENTAGVVRHIFEQFVRTECYEAVVDDLNGRRINPPYIYKKTGEVFFVPGSAEYKGWDKSAVSRILKSETYSGRLVQGKTSITAKNEKNRIHKKQEEWVICENAHEPLVDRELIMKAGQTREKISARTESYGSHTEGYPIGENIFDGILYCGVCGRKMTRNSRVKTYADGSKGRLEGYFCMNGKQTKVDRCPLPNRISKTELTDILLPLLRREFAVYLDKPKKYLDALKGQLADKSAETDRKINLAERKLADLMEEERQKYREYREKGISQSEYVAYKMRHEDRLHDLNRQMEELEAERKNLDIVSDKYQTAARSIIRLKSCKELSKEMIRAFISRVYVYPGKRIETEFSYTNELLEGVLRNG